MKSSPARFFEFRLLAVCALVMTIHAPASGVTIDWVTVGNAGNAGEITGNGAGSFWPTAVVGGVSYEYRIGKYEVTNAQYAEFLNGVDPNGTNNLGLYSAAMSYDPRGGINFNGGAAAGARYELKGGQQNNPVVFVDWYDAIRFTNWVQNGGGSGNTEDGAYTLTGNSPVPGNASTISRNSGTQVFLPTESEWYKAAYHKNDGVTGNYWDFATRTDVVPYSDNPASINTPDASNTGNVYRDDTISNGYDDGYAVTGSTAFPLTNTLTNIGAYGLAVGPYGTFDQGDNVKEWNETLIIDGNGLHRGVSGGSWSTGSDAVAASVRFFGDPVDQFETYDNIGFRLGAYMASTGPGGGSGAAPEPSSLLLAAVGALTILRRRRKRQPVL